MLEKSVRRVLQTEHFIRGVARCKVSDTPAHPVACHSQNAPILPLDSEVGCALSAVLPDAPLAFGVSTTASSGTASVVLPVSFLFLELDLTGLVKSPAKLMLGVLSGSAG